MEYANLQTDLPVFDRRAPDAPAFAFRPSRVAGGDGTALFRPAQTAAASYWSSRDTATARQTALTAQRQAAALVDVNARGYHRAMGGATSEYGNDGLARPTDQDQAIPFSRLSAAFFSAANEAVLQEGLRAGVYDLSTQPGHTGPAFALADQDPAALRSVMRDVYLERYADAVPAGAGADPLGAQIAVFNAWVWRTMVPTLYSAARQQYHYLTHFREPVPVMQFTSQTDRDFRDDIDGRRRLQFKSQIVAPNGALAAAAGRNQFLEGLRGDVTSRGGTDRGNINRLTAAAMLM